MSFRFKDRAQAGRKLAGQLGKFRHKDCVVFALPRGGLITAFEVAKKLGAQLDLLIPRKIGHPQNPEYALAAVSEEGDLVVSSKEQINTVDTKWFHQEVERQRQEALRRRKLYLKNSKIKSLKGKIAIVVDDGIATGLTIRAAIKELRRRQPKTVVVAVPVVSKTTAEQIKKEVDKFISLETPDEFYAIGAFYDSFPQVSDDEVIEILAKANSQDRYKI